MAWTNLLDAVLGHKKPVTLQMLRALRDNPIAIAEGALGAPRIQPAAMAQPLVSASGQVASGSGWMAFTGLDEVKTLKVDFSLSTNGAGVNFLNVAFSSDGGVSWGTTQSIYNSGGETAGSRGVAQIDLESGDCRGHVFILTATTSAVVSTTASFTVPANCNAIRFAGTAGTGRVAGVSIMSLGGRA